MIQLKAILNNGLTLVPVTIVDFKFHRDNYDQTEMLYAVFIYEDGTIDYCKRNYLKVEM